jgi:hypothetical protein
MIVERLEWLLFWLYHKGWLRRPEPGVIPPLVWWLWEWERRRCYLVPMSLARYGFVEVDGIPVNRRIFCSVKPGSWLTVLPSGKIWWDGEPPVGTFRIRRWDVQFHGWLVYR